MSVAIPKPTKKAGTSAKRAKSSGGKKKAVPAAKKKPRKRTLPRKKIVKELDELCSKITSIIWGGKCGVCGKAGTQAHHFFGKKTCSGLRWVPDNLIWLCFYCHIIRNHRQGLVEIVRKALTRRIGLKRFDELYAVAFIPKKMSTAELLALKDELSSQLEKLTPAG